jgi:hypothetical protein
MNSVQENRTIPELKDEKTNNLQLHQLLGKNRDGSVPLINFMKNTEIFIRKYEVLFQRVQEIERRIGIENVENTDISKMKPISFYFPPVNLVEKKDIISDLDNQLLRNLEFMEKQSQQVKEMLHSKEP